MTRAPEIGTVDDGLGLPDGVRVEVRRSLDGIAEPWDELVAASCRPSPFLRSWWLDGVASSRPRIACVFAGDELIGGLPLEEDHRAGVTRLRFIGAVLAADHLDAISARGHDQPVRDALSWWLRRPGTRIVELVGLDDDARVTSMVPPPIHHLESDVAPWAVLPATFDEYWATRPSTLRNNVKRASRRLERDGVRYERVSPARADEVLAQFEALHRDRWTSDSTLSPLFGRFARAAGEGMRRGELVAHRMALGDEAIAIELWFELAGVASFYQGGRSLDRSWRGAGSVLKAHVVEDACNRGMREIDLLRGDEPYKADWTDQRRTVEGITSVQGVLARVAWAGFHRLRTVRNRRRWGAGHAD